MKLQSWTDKWAIGFGDKYKIYFKIYDYAVI